MATIAPQTAIHDGVVPAEAAASGGGDKFLPGERIFLIVKNTDASPHDVIIDDPTSIAPGDATTFNPDSTVTVANATQKVFGPFPADRWANPTDGLVAVTYSSATGMKISVISLPAA